MPGLMDTLIVRGRPDNSSKHLPPGQAPFDESFAGFLLSYELCQRGLSAVPVRSSTLLTRCGETIIIEFI